MKKLEHLSSVYTELLKNNPLKNEEQFDFFSELAIEHFESLEKNEFPSDHFYTWWMFIGRNKAKLKFQDDVNLKTKINDFDDFLMSEQVYEWYHHTWLLDTVLFYIPND